MKKMSGTLKPKNDGRDNEHVRDKETIYTGERQPVKMGWTCGTYHTREIDEGYLR